MMDKICENVNYINEAFRDRSLNKKFERLILNECEIKNLTSAVEILHCFDYATTLLSATNYTTISVCLPIIYLLQENLKVDKNDSNFSSTLKTVLNSSIEFYTQKYKLKDKKEYIIATFLDPRFKHFSRMPEKPKDNYLKESKKILKEYVKNLNTNVPNSSTPSQTLSPTPEFEEPALKRKKLNIYDYETTVTNKSSASRMSPIEKEIIEYLSKAVDEKTTCEIFWAQNKKIFPLLFNAAKHFLCIPATSVPSENLFSHAGYNVWDRRNKLAPSTVKKTMIIYENHSSVTL